MKILIVDDSNLSRQVIKDLLISVGYSDLVLFDSATALFQYLEIDSFDFKNENEIPDLILLDIIMKGVDGIEACKLIKSRSRLRDIQIIMVTSKNEDSELEKSFHAGARDYITKPYNKIELLARINSAIQLKREMDLRKLHEMELLKIASELNHANNTLRKLSFIDSLTGIANKRYFEHIVPEEWKKAIVDKIPVAIFMIDVDFFKRYNDNYGHVYGDQTLSHIATALKNTLSGNSDILARFGGEEFIAYLPNCDFATSKKLAGNMNVSVRSLNIPHALSDAANIVTASIGVVSLIPDEKIPLAKAINIADKALYKAKSISRNCFRAFKIEPKN